MNQNNSLEQMSTNDNVLCKHKPKVCQFYQIST